MKKKKSPKEIIESVENPEFEESWFKLPGEEIKVNSISQSRGKRGVATDKGKVRAEINLSGRKYKDYVYAGIHTHPGFNKEDYFTLAYDTLNNGVTVYWVTNDPFLNMM